ncbi:fimbria/pilus periplasmic chaperone [Scandinavium goeteborgense]|uniref:Pili/flagellar assembly PapD-like chaperone n=1 Tax=Scandinavium goeteborgense TaxID=1851514 RepID=A0A4R6EMA2_SCAGO|nr:fimbria/pilus periplasmic chaperone [Scandinavium goeteborgense]TDN60116.1 pili/flagellar assembly PapD-like chaperone [Scandinavium goeteborgense]
MTATHKICSTLLLLVLSSLAPAQANVTVFPMRVMLNQQGSGVVNVISKSTETRYMVADVRRVEHPATPQESEVKVKMGSIDSLVVTPARFALPAGAIQPLRIINIKPLQKEVSYRVWLNAVPGSTPDVTVPAGNDDVSTAVGIEMSWGVVVNVPPEHPQVKLVIDTAAQRVANQGNIHTVIARVGDCTDSSHCRWTDINKSVYADETLDISAAHIQGKSLQNIKLEYIDPVTHKTVTTPGE